MSRTGRAVVEVAQASHCEAMVVREHRIIVIFLGSALVHVRLVSGFITVELTNGITRSDQLEACAVAFALLPRKTASPTGGVSEPFGAFASSTPPGWSLLWRPDAQVSRIDLSALRARPVGPIMEVISGVVAGGGSVAFGSGLLGCADAVPTQLGLF